MTMEERLYEWMDWGRIEALVYSEEDHPSEILGPHLVEGGLLIQAFFPGETSLSLHTLANDKVIPMVCEDEAGFFALLLPGKRVPDYRFVRSDGSECGDPYRHRGWITEGDQKRFQAGIWYDACRKMGAHPVTESGVRGVRFAVWAPNACRVSLVGDFNHWDGRQNPMDRLESGIFELFMPDLEPGMLYKYEIKLADGLTYLKADPFARGSQLMPDTASVVTDLSHDWKDGNWMKIRKARQSAEAPIFIYEVNLSEWAERSGEVTYDWEILGESICRYVLEAGYTHVELMPVMEYPDDLSCGYDISGYFAPTRRFGDPGKFAAFVDILHRAGIGLILDWNPAWFARGDFGLSSFDGSPLFENGDPRCSLHPTWGTPTFRYGRGEVTSFLLSSALFWLRDFHADGLRLNDVASMLYLDYARGEGDWNPNLYGGNENLEAIEFLKHLNSIVKKQVPGVLMIAEDSSGWPMLTGNLNQGGLGFDYRWNLGWREDFVKYLQLDPFYRKSHQEDLLLSTVYAFQESYILEFSHDLVHELGGILAGALPGVSAAQKLAGFRQALAYMTAHPGKKMLGMDQDQTQRLDKAPDGEEALTGRFLADLIRLYSSHPALFGRDGDPRGFEWISNLDAARSLLVFVRKSGKKSEDLLVVCNFSAEDYRDLRVGVPRPGKYKEILNTDAEIYGGEGRVNSRVRTSRPIEADERKNSIKLRMAPLSVGFFSWSEADRSAGNRTASGRKAAARSGDGLKKKLEDLVYRENDRSKKPKNG